MNKIYLFTLALLASKTNAAMPANEVLRPAALEFYNSTYKTYKRHKAFAYAREAATGKDTRSASYGYNSLEEARKNALANCQKRNLKSPCRIIDEDGKFIATPGDFSKLTPVDNTPISKKVKQHFLADAKTLVKGNCYPYISSYLSDKGHRAFAYSLDANGNYACGKAFNGTIRSVHELAIKACETNKKKRGKKAPKAGCQVIAIDNKMIAALKDFGIDDTILFKQALFKGDLKSIKQYIANGAKVNTAEDKDGVTALFVAAGKGDEAFFHQLIAKQADIHHKTKDGSNLLIAATAGENPNIIRFLLKKGFDINSKGKDGNRPLHVALGKLNTYIVGILIRHGADITLKNDEGKSVKAIAKKWKVDLDEMKILDANKPDYDGTYPIFFAAKYGDREAVKNLIAQKANLDDAYDGYSSLHYADINVIKLLVDAGADINHQNYTGNTPLMTNIDDLEKVKLFLSLGANKQIKNKAGKTAYDLAKENKSSSQELLKLLKP